ncbi:MAG TPA: DUF4389 domain-containing protein [Mycobacteriales bacterium]|jgi:hypothetical protein
MDITERYDVRVEAAPEPGPLSRWLWIVKWLLLIPHYVVLFFLGIGFVVVTVVAFLAILVTGRYPRPLFGYAVGVLRWSWRVSYYGYGALGTDRYPPFTLADVPDYPARFDVAYPERLSRGLVLVKWWLLALPHYLILGLFTGATLAVGSRAGEGRSATLPGLLDVVVLFAAVALLFTARYPRGLYDLALGIDRWMLRVVAYATLLTDRYPPFRLDQGGPDRAPRVSAGSG